MRKIAQTTESADQEAREARNATYEANHVEIRSAFLLLVKTHKRKPTLAELKQATGLSMQTIQKHTKYIKFEPAKSSLRVLTDDVLLSIFRGALEGNPADKKLWLQVMEGWKETAVKEIKKDHSLETARDELFKKLSSRINPAGTTGNDPAA